MSFSPVVEKASFEEDGAAIFDLVNECYAVETGSTGVCMIRAEDGVIGAF